MRVRSTLLAFVFPLLSGIAGAAETFPAKAVRIIVPFAPGGSTDVVFRTLQPELSKQLGQPVVIENRPGGAATIGMNVVARAPADGYTLGVATLSFAANPPFLKQDIPFDTEKDFTPVSLVARYPLVLEINPSVPARSVTELVEYSRKNPNALNYGSTGIASSGHLGGALFVSLSGAKVTHVPYSNTSVVSAIVAGDIQVLAGAIPSSLQFIQSGKLIALGVTSPKRVASLPNVPTIAEAGVPGFEMYEWAGVVAPAGTPEAVIEKLHTAIANALQVQAVRESMTTGGAEVVGNTPAEFQSFIKSELTKWTRIANDVATQQTKRP